MQENMMKLPMVGCKAPKFTANSTFGPIKLTDYMGKWLILFCHVSDFTPVCTTEMISFSNLNNELKRRNCEVLAMSNDSNPSHIAWTKDIEKSSGVIVPFPIISDKDRMISSMYGINCCNDDESIHTRNVYIIDPEQRIRCIMVYPENVGRNVTEILRMVDALQMTDKDCLSAPANWMPGNDMIESSPQNYIELMDRLKVNNANNSIDWYLNTDIRRW